MGSLYKQEKSPFWWADYTDHRGKRVRKSTRCRDKANAKKVLAKLESDDTLVGHGLKSSVSDARQELLSNHLEDYYAHLKAKKTEKYAKETKNQIDAVANYAGWDRLSDISANGLEDWTVLLRDEGRGARTVRSYINAVQMFCNWLVRRKCLLGNPVAGVEKPKLKSGRIFNRRMLLEDEWKWLSKFLAASTKVRKGMTAEARRLMYWTAVETGLRSNELRSLVKANVKLTSKEPHIICNADTTKSGELARQFISDELVRSLRPHLKPLSPRDVVFQVKDRHRMAKVLADDLADARKLWEEMVSEDEVNANPDFLEQENGNSELLDFHALRHTTGAWLVNHGVSLPEVQKIMRHSTIQLTIDHYGHLAPDAASRHRNLLSAVFLS